MALFLAPFSFLSGVGEVSVVLEGTDSQDKQADPRTVRTISAAPTAEPITIDGVLSESVWKTAGFGGFTQRDPLDGQPATEPTTVWVAFDHDNLYIAARLADSEPSQIVGRLGRRDEYVESDWFDVGVDPYYDRRSGYFFGVNPFGSIEDGTLSNDEQTDSTWDGIWESAARIDDGGWAVEIRIPFDQLRFKRQDVYVWGVNFQRVVKRKNEESHFAWVPKEESGLVSRFADLTGLAGIAAGRRLEISPFAVSQAKFSPAEPGNPFRTGHRLAASAGFDLKGGLSSNLTLDLSVNPDFGQVKEFGEGRSGLGFIATSLLRDLRERPLDSFLSRSALALGVEGWTFLDKDEGWALAGWAGLTTVRGSAEAMTDLQLSSLHYFQRPDADWVEVDENATALSGWAGRLPELPPGTALPRLDGHGILLPEL